VTEGGLVVSPNENNRRAQAFRAMMVTAPDPGTNTLIARVQIAQWSSSASDEPTNTALKLGSRVRKRYVE
jgi:hypothetical protein